MNTMSLPVALFLLIFSFVTGYQVSEWKSDKVELKHLKVQAKADAEMREKLFQISEETTEAISNIRVENKTIYNRTEREVLKEPVYTECVLTPEGISLINKARTN